MIYEIEKSEGIFGSISVAWKAINYVYETIFQVLLEQGFGEEEDLDQSDEVSYCLGQILLLNKYT